MNNEKRGTGRPKDMSCMADQWQKARVRSQGPSRKAKAPFSVALRKRNKIFWAYQDTRGSQVSTSGHLGKIPFQSEFGAQAVSQHREAQVRA